MIGKADKVAEALRTALANEKYCAGAPLPSVRELALLHRINPNTIVRAFELLLNDGLVVVEARRGYFVARGAVERARALLRHDAKVRLRHAVDDAVDAGLERDEIETVVSRRLREASRKHA